MEKPKNNTVDFLWHSFLNGNDKSFTLIYYKQVHKLISYGCKLCGNRELVRDCVQEVFIDLYLKRQKLNVKIRNLKAYLFIALRNCIIKKITQRRKTESINNYNEDANGIFKSEYNFQDQLMAYELSEEIKSKLFNAINGLPPKQKEIIYLKFEEEMEYDEISEIMKISIDSARKLMYRSLISLRKIINPDIILNLFFASVKKT